MMMHVTTSLSVGTIPLAASNVYVSSSGLDMGGVRKTRCPYRRFSSITYVAIRHRNIVNLEMDTRQLQLETWTRARTDYRRWVIFGQVANMVWLGR